MTEKPKINDLKEYDKKFVVEDNTLYEMWEDNISKSEVIWDMENIADLLNSLYDENEQLKQANNMLYNENIQLRRILVNYKDLINDVKYLEEKGVFDGKKDKKNIWDVEPVVEKHS